MFNFFCFDFGSEKSWDFAGIGFGLIGCGAILSQLIGEIQREGESSLSFIFILGFFLVFTFWLLYGLRFKRPAIIVTNLLAAVLQGLLLITLLVK